MAGGLDWDAAALIALMSWLVSPIITLLTPKILSCLGLDTSQKLRDLKIHIIPELQQTLREVDQARMLQRGEVSDVSTLDEMASWLRHARGDADDIFDDAHEKIAGGDILHGTAQACIRGCQGITRILQSGSARLLQLLWNISLSRRLLYRSEDAPTVATSSDSLGRLLSCWWSSLVFFKNCYRTILYWLVHAVEVASFCRNWSYDVVGITSNQVYSISSPSSHLICPLCTSVENILPPSEIT